MPASVIFVGRGLRGCSRWSESFRCAPTSNKMPAPIPKCWNFKKNFRFAKQISSFQNCVGHLAVIHH